MIMNNDFYTAFITPQYRKLLGADKCISIRSLFHALRTHRETLIGHVVDRCKPPLSTKCRAFSMSSVRCTLNWNFIEQRMEQLQEVDEYKICSLADRTHTCRIKVRFGLQMFLILLYIYSKIGVDMFMCDVHSAKPNSCTPGRSIHLTQQLAK